MEHFFFSKYDLGLWELKNDILSGKILSDRFNELIDFAWEIGSTAAERCTEKYKTDNPVELLKRLGIELEEHEEISVPQYRIFSEYYSNMRKIILYKKTITEGFERLQEKGIINWDDYEKQKQLFIAHEIFHHLECHEIGRTSRKSRITTFKIGPLEIKSGIKALSEIGAHSFTKGLMKLESR